MRPDISFNDTQRYAALKSVRDNKHVAATINAQTSIGRGGTSMSAKIKYQQDLFRGLSKPPQKNEQWTQLDFYDIDSPETSEILENYFHTPSLDHTKRESGQDDLTRGVVRRTGKILYAETSQACYVNSLIGNVNGVVDEWNIRGSDLGTQIRVILSKLNTATLSQIKSHVPVSSLSDEANAEKAVIAHLECCGLLVDGIWIIASELSSTPSQLYDLRNIIIALLWQNRKPTISAISSVTKRSDNEVYSVIKDLGKPTEGGQWVPRNSDPSFITSYPEVVTRQESKHKDMLAAVRAKFSGKTGDHKSTDEDAQIVSVKNLGAKGVCFENEVLDILTASGGMNREVPFKSEDAVSILISAGFTKFRNGWILQRHVLENDEDVMESYRQILFQLYRQRDSFTKDEIKSEIIKQGSLKLSDHQVRRLLKEIAVQRKGYWVYKGVDLNDVGMAGD